MLKHVFHLKNSYLKGHPVFIRLYNYAYMDDGSKPLVSMLGKENRQKKKKIKIAWSSVVLFTLVTL